MSRMKELYQKQITKELMDKFKFQNVNQVPKITKVVVNAGVGRSVQNSKFLDDTIKAMTTVTGQAPVVTKAKKSIAGFKIREGMKIGTSVTLRGERMYEFLDRLVSISLPRVRDFRGLNPAGFDGQGNYNIGIKEHGVFPEISFEEANPPIGMQINITTTAKKDEEGKALLAGLGFPFRS